MELTQENYHSAEANLAYMSNSQFGAFLKCPAAEYAKLHHGYDQGPKVYFEVGSYIDCQLLTPENYPKWYGEHLGALIDTGCISKRDKTTKNAPLVAADAMIAKAQSDAVFMEYLSGHHQTIMTFELGGVKWKMMCDVMNGKKARIVDLKSTKSIVGEDWLDRRTIFDFMANDDTFIWTKGPFYEEHNYWRQGALYPYGAEYNLGFTPQFYIAALSKQAPPDIGVFHFGDKHRMADEIETVRQFLPFVLKWKSGEEIAPRCERCEYCRETKKVIGPVEAVSMTVAA